MSKVLVTGYKKYSFTREDGQVLEGVKVSYLSENKAQGIEESGFLPLQSSLNLNTLPSFKEIPGIYDVSYGMVPGKGNKPKLDITGFKFLKSVDLDSLFR